MPQLSLGLIETVGLAAAIEAADTAVKAANVELIGYELTRGDGMAVIKIQGEVGAVNAAVSAAAQAAARVGRVASIKVIPRPAEGIEGLVVNADTVGVPVPPEGGGTPPVPPAAPDKEAAPSAEAAGSVSEAAETSVTPAEPAKPVVSTPAPAPKPPGGVGTPVKSEDAPRETGSAPKPATPGAADDTAPAGGSASPQTKPEPPDLGGRPGRGRRGRGNKNRA